MPKELELAGLASAGGWLNWRRKHADMPPGSPCGNCETPLQGPYCHTCGQLAEEFHKSVWSLFMEALESFFHFDGRLWRTLPNLVIRPGSLTHSYLSGKRQAQIPPFRMFLVTLLIVFLVGHYASGDRPQTSEQARAAAGEMTPSQEARAEFRRNVMEDQSLTPAEKETQLAAAEGRWADFGAALGQDIAEKSAEANAASARTAGAGEKAAAGAGRSKGDGSGIRMDEDDEVRLFGKENQAATDWFRKRVQAINDDPERFFLVLEVWAHRVAVLALPVSALILSLLFVFQRRFYVFDHLVFSMHSLAFQLLLLTTIFILGALVGPVAWWLLLAAPAHLFAHMRGTYATSVIGTLLRMAVLFFFTVVAFSLLAVLWLYLGFSEMAR